MEKSSLSQYSPAIFISYRRESGGHAGRLFDHLAERFGSNKIFFDRSTIEYGSFFNEQIANGINGARVVLVVITPVWADSFHARHADKGKVDYVKQELVQALDRMTATCTLPRIIPVLMAGATMPEDMQLVAVLGDHSRKFCALNAHEVRDSAWSRDIAELIRSLDRMLNLRDEQESTSGNHGALDHHTALTSEQRRLLMHLSDHSHVAPHRSLLESVAKPSQLVHGLKGYLLKRYAECALRMDQVFGDDDDTQMDLHFVQLQLMAERRDSQDSDTGQPGVEVFKSLREMLSALPNVRLWKISADPGAGKSTIMRHYEWSTAKQGLANWSDFDRVRSEGEARPTLCLSIPIQRLASVGSDFEHWLDLKWSSLFPGVPPLGRLCERFGVTFLIDAINELDPKVGSTRRQIIDRIAFGLLNLPGISPPVFTVRTGDDIYGLGGPGATRHARLLRWDHDAMREFCESRGEAGSLVWRSIEQDERLLELCRLPLHLAAQCQVIRLGILDRPALNRADLFCALLWGRLARECAAGRSLCDAETMGLLDQADLRKIARMISPAPGENRPSLRDLPLNGLMLRALMQQAFDMQGRGTETPLAKLTGIGASGKRRHAWLRAAAALDIADFDQRDRFQFRHQELWQEFLVALYLTEMRADQWPDFSAPPLQPIEEARATGSPLRHAVSIWEEPVKLSLQLDTDLNRWIDCLLDRNPALAARGLVNVPVALEVDALESVRGRLLRDSGDPEIDVRLRLEAAEALSGIGDPRYVWWGDNGTPPRVWMSPHERQWVEVLGGCHAVGDDESVRQEGPRTVVTTDGFQIARAPVTNEEFKYFVQDGGYSDPAWWSSYVNQRFATVTFSESWLIDFTVRYGAMFSPRRTRWPAGWDHGASVVPTQPVAGVSLYEAMAYAAWLTARGDGWIYRLPRESEWEVAATMSNDQLRSSTWPAHEAHNLEEVGLRRISAVGVFSCAGGLTDMLGNVDEWTTSKYSDRHDARVLLQRSKAFHPKVERVLRGGSHYSSRDTCKVTSRFGSPPVARLTTYGFRLVRTPAPGRGRGKR